MSVTREELTKWRCEELAQYCREHNVPHYHGKNRFRKDEMIEAILKRQKPVVEQTTQCEEKIDDASVAVKGEEATGKKIDENKERYLENVKIGTLVAFRESSGKLNTAAVQNVSFKRRQLRLVTQYDKEYIVSFDDVVWVRTKKRWPMFVLSELKQRSGKT